MWPSIPAYRSFANIACPSEATCELPNCIFSHDASRQTTTRRSPVPITTTYDREPNAKRLKLEGHGKECVAQAAPAPAKAKPSSFVDLTKPKDEATTADKDTPPSKTAPSKIHARNDTPPTLPSSATRPVSPPPVAATAKPVVNPDTPVALMPRKLNKEPANLTKRVTLLKALHGYMKPQNDKLLKAVKPEIKALYLTPNQLNKLAVDEEEKMATSNPSVYENILKQRLVKLKTMTPEVWVAERREAMAKQSGEPAKKPAKKVDTGLTPKEEVMLLSVLKCPQDGLDAHGYVTKLPAAADLNETHLALEAAAGWEQCDRCNTRFQVFPERREEDGLFTTGGECKYHWGKRIFPKKSRCAAVPEPTRLTCCNAEVGSTGCTTHETHVYNVKNSKRLSLIMPFIQTPENGTVAENTAVCFDCEMGYTTNGLEMLRLTVISWPQHKPLVDVLVRPLGHLLDVNTRFSGITLDQFINAKPYSAENAKPVRKDLRIVESPYAARDLFLAHVSPQTPVLGHALENDLNTIRLIHPHIIDTVLLFPTRQGLPFRHGLRKLAQVHLDEDIQQGGAAGHDSYEDARTTGELVRLKIKDKWKVMREEGWQIRDDGVHAPMPAEAPPPSKQAPSAAPMVPEAKMAFLEGAPAVKRKMSDDDNTDDDELPVKKLEQE
ncbi:hypothetical protein GMOD_00000843 [Pyrenophora seminiperda CCB06]|uniref:Exonuclease domain-containing protein n=1 Tax=Pyrenophora seminiperda CCB06 TaxID=1302712 RepID=A0A3M7M8B8_9PLEO|nr:hypothetical protein GMOD_00000843 [Pyrenophora seminiperda CCB06]